MLSDNPAASSPQPEVCPDESIHRLPQPLLLHQQQQQAIPARALALRSSTGQLVIPENGSLYTSRQQLKRRAVTPNSSLSRSSLQYPIQPSALTPLSEYHSGFTDEDLGSPCPFPTPFTGQTNHRRQQSFPNSLPLTLRSRTPSPTRKTHRRFPSEQMPFTGDGRRNIAARTESPRGGLSGWLGGTATAASALGISLNNTTETRSQSNGTNSGSSAFNASNSSSSTITSNIPTSLTTTTNDTNPTPNVTPSKVRATGTTTITNDPSTPKNNINSTMTSRFMSAISSRFNTPSAQSTPSRVDVDDEIVNLNIEAALFPSGSAADRDSFSPAAFKNFQMNAVGLLTKIQSAYKDRVVALRDLEAERSAQQDELEEAETRAKHLKFQLEGMAAKAAEQERAMKQLMDELSAERKARQQLALMTSTVAASTSSSARAASVVSEDLGIDEIEARRKRKSADSRSFDDSEEDEIESAESESVFSISRCRSPTVTTTTTMTTTTTATSATTAQTQTQLPLIHYATNGSVPDSPPQVVGTPTTRGFGGSANVTPRQKTINGGAVQMSAFQKIFKGISGGNNEETNGCSNCKGKDASVAWDTVGLLRDENRHLKTRVTELEGAVEGALDVVRGIGL